MKKIILIDWDEKAYQLQPRNSIHRLKKWKGEEDDTDLVYLASFLKSKHFIHYKLNFFQILIHHH